MKKFKRSDTILKELREHLPFSLGVSFLAGVLVAVFYFFGGIVSSGLFEVLHPLHVLVSAGATAAIFRKYKSGKARSGCRGVGVSGCGIAILVGVIGAILIGSVSDVLLPWIAGNVFSFETVFHLPIIEEPFLILGAAIVGSLVGIFFGLFKLNHFLHVFFSVFASLFYLLAFSVSISWWVVLLFSLIVFICVYVPCCISDIVFPLFFIKEPCRNCGHWH